jgi:L-ribulose-5-phosphate 4-epimerase
MSEGLIKFDLEWIRDHPFEFPRFEDLNGWREKLYMLGLIGAYPNGVGFGNISARIDHTDTFVISGSGTGKLQKLSPDHYTPVVKFDIESFSLTCKGPIKASSESLSHAVFYRLDPKIGAVIHVHNRQLWTNMVKKAPTTVVTAAYGTPQMAHEIERLLTTTDAKARKVIAMGGHEEGIMSFGKDLTEAGNILLEYYQREVQSSPESVWCNHPN